MTEPRIHLAVVDTAVIEVEVWSGFVCEPFALDGAVEITRHGGWRNHLAARADPR